MKFTATLRLLVAELSTLSSAFEVDGGQLRLQASLLLGLTFLFHTSCLAVVHKSNLVLWCFTQFSYLIGWKQA